MKNSTNILLVSFFAVSVSHLACIACQFQLGILITKPLLLTTLAAWLYFETKGSPTLFSRLMLAGLLFSLAGDTFLMFVKSGGEQFFLLGLGSFLAAHICYISGFLKFPRLKAGLVWRQPLLNIPFLFFLVMMLSFLWSGLPGSMKIPVVSYCFTIVFMAINALNMNGRISGNASQKLFFGAVLFVLSDAFIAVHRFKFSEMPEVPTSLSIMATYIAGQFLLAKGSSQANAEASSFLFS